MKIAEILLKTQALKVNCDEKFIFASGIESPIYCDNRTLISFVMEREIIVERFIERIKSLDFKFDAICATATAGIPWGSFIAQELKLPLLYVRSGEKSHGLKKLIEGNTQNIKSVIVIEDLISTGKSSIDVCNTLKSQDINPKSVLSIFDYGLKRSKEKFSSINQPYQSLTGLDELCKYALESNLLTQKDTDIILEWKNSINS